MKLEDSIAESLEERGLWHRAARRWLAVMDGSKNDAERELIAGGRAESRRLYKARQRYNEGYRFKNIQRFIGDLLKIDCFFSENFYEKKDRFIGVVFN